MCPGKVSLSFEDTFVFLLLVKDTECHLESQTLGPPASPTCEELSLLCPESVALKATSTLQFLTLLHFLC